MDDLGSSTWDNVLDENRVSTLWDDVIVPHKRHAIDDGTAEIPSDLTVVSVDGHWSLAEDIFIEFFPDHLKDKAPRILMDDKGLPQLCNPDGSHLMPPGVQEILAMYEGVPGATSVERRVADLEKEGIRKEINFGNTINYFLRYPDVEVRDWAFRAYNHHLSRLQKTAPGRFYGAGLINFWDMDKVGDSVAELKELGLKTIHMPNLPHAGDNKPINYIEPAMAPLWTAIEDAGLPVCFHVGEGGRDGVQGRIIGQLIDMGPFRKQFAELVFGGILDRHPKLQVVFVEADLNWIPGCLQHAEMLNDAFATILDFPIEKRPSEYWHNNFYATFQSDPIGLKMLDIIGADRVMWSSDYPHPESTFGMGAKPITNILNQMPERDARMILGDNAMRVFGLD